MKIKIDGAEVLTTQIYFDGDPLLDGDGLAAAAGDELALLTTNAVPGTLSNGQRGLVARHVIVLASRKPNRKVRRRCEVRSPRNWPATSVRRCRSGCR